MIQLYFFLRKEKKKQIILRETFSDNKFYNNKKFVNQPTNNKSIYNT